MARKQKGTVQLVTLGKPMDEETAGEPCPVSIVKCGEGRF